MDKKDYKALQKYKRTVDLICKLVNAKSSFFYNAVTNRVREILEHRIEDIYKIDAEKLTMAIEDDLDGNDLFILAYNEGIHRTVYKNSKFEYLDFFKEQGKELKKIVASDTNNNFYSNNVVLYYLRSLNAFEIFCIQDDKQKKPVINKLVKNQNKMYRDVKKLKESGALKKLYNLIEEYHSIVKGRNLQINDEAIDNLFRESKKKKTIFSKEMYDGKTAFNIFFRCNPTTTEELQSLKIYLQCTQLEFGQFFFHIFRNIEENEVDKLADILCKFIYFTDNKDKNSRPSKFKNDLKKSYYPSTKDKKMLVRTTLNALKILQK